MIKKIPRLFYQRIVSWVRKNKFEVILVSIILILGSFLRLYKIDEYMTFLGDEGRDVIVVRNLLVKFDPILVGPGTSIGDMYLGPLYYYLIAPFLLLANFSPVGPAVMVALLGVATIFLVWYITREWFGKLPSILAALLYAIAPIVIIYSRSSWNPNIMPFFATLTIYSIWKVWNLSFNRLAKDQKFAASGFKWLIVLGISFAFVLQSHYLGLLLAPVISIFWFLTYINLQKLPSDYEKYKREFFKYTFFGFFSFLVLMSPLIIFDARHNFRNFSSMKRFFMERQTTISARPWTALPKLLPIFEKVNTRLLTGTSYLAGRYLSYFLELGILLCFFRLIYSKKSIKDTKRKAFLLLFTWLGFALVGLGVYKQEIYDHYYGFFFTGPFILFGGVFAELLDVVRKKSIYLRFTIYAFLSLTFLLLLYLNIRESPISYPPNRQLQRTQEVAKKIIEESEGKEFNLAVIAERNYEGAYQYFLELWQAPLVKIDPQKADATITNQLFVVCELPRDKCDPTHNPKAEIANFGWSSIEKEWEVGGVILYKLVHTR